MGIPANVKWKQLEMLSSAPKSAAKTSSSIFWTLFGAIASAGAAVLAMSQALTSTLQKCQEGMGKIANDLNKPASVKAQNVASEKDE